MVSMIPVSWLYNKAKYDIIFLYKMSLRKKEHLLWPINEYVRPPNMLEPVGIDITKPILINDIPKDWVNWIYYQFWF